MESRMRSAKDSAENPPNYKIKIIIFQFITDMIIFYDNINREKHPTNNQAYHGLSSGRGISSPPT